MTQRTPGKCKAPAVPVILTWTPSGSFAEEKREVQREMRPKPLGEQVVSQGGTHCVSLQKHGPRVMTMTTKEPARASGSGEEPVCGPDLLSELQLERCRWELTGRRANDCHGDHPSSRLNRGAEGTDEGEA